MLVKSWLTADKSFPITMLLSGAADPTVVKIFTFINSKSATMFSAFHRFLVLELNSDSSKNQNQLSEKPLARKYFFRWSIFRLLLSPLGKARSKSFFSFVRKWKLFYWTLIGQFCWNYSFLLFMRKILFFCQIEKKRENGITKIGNAEFSTNFTTKC